MKKHLAMIKRISVALLVTLALVAGQASPVYATSVSDLERQKKEDQKKLNNTNNSIKNMQGEQNELQEEMDEIDEQLVEVIASVEMIEGEIVEKEAQIEVTEAAYNEAKAREEEQYEAMKIRIKYMYEQGDVSYVQLLVQSTSFSDMLNKADYIEQLYEYDRKLLLEYQQTKEECQALWNQLEEEKAELEAQQHELEEEKEMMETMLAEKKQKYEDYEQQIAKAKQEAAAYSARIKQANAEIKKLLEAEAKKKAEEAARKKAADIAAGAGSSGGGSYNGASSYGGNGQAVANYACQFVGNPYVPGGTSLTQGADCSGFVWRVYKDFGYSLPRTSGALRGAGREVSPSEAQPGDIVCYAGHVAIYIGGGTIVHASTQKTGIKISNWSYKPILTVRRIM